MGRLGYWATCVCCSPAALRETPPVPPVILPLCPAVNRLKLQRLPLQLLPPLPPPRPQLQLKVNSREIVVFMSFKTFNINGMFESERKEKILTRSQLHLLPLVWVFKIYYIKREIQNCSRQWVLWKIMKISNYKSYSICLVWFTVYFVCMFYMMVKVTSFSVFKR